MYNFSRNSVQGVGVKGGLGDGSVVCVHLALNTVDWFRTMDAGKGKQ